MKHEHLDRLRRIAEEGENPLTPVAHAGLALVVVAPLLGLRILLADRVVYFE